MLIIFAWSWTKFSNYSQLSHTHSNRMICWGKVIKVYIFYLIETQAWIMQPSHVYIKKEWECKNKIKIDNLINNKSFTWWMQSTSLQIQSIGAVLWCEVCRRSLESCPPPRVRSWLWNFLVTLDEKLWIALGADPRFSISLFLAHPLFSCNYLSFFQRFT